MFKGRARTKVHGVDAISNDVFHDLSGDVKGIGSHGGGIEDQLTDKI